MYRFNSIHGFNLIQFSINKIIVQSMITLIQDLIWLAWIFIRGGEWSMKNNESRQI